MIARNRFTHEISRPFCLAVNRGPAGRAPPPRWRPRRAAAAELTRADGMFVPSARIPEGTGRDADGRLDAVGLADERPIASRQQPLRTHLRLRFLMRMIPMPQKPSPLVFLSLVSLLAALCNCLGCGSKDIPLVTSGVSNYSIVYASDAIEAEKTAAAELAEHLKLSFGIDIPVKEEAAAAATAAAQARGPAIYVGQTRFAASQGISFANYGAEEWLLKSVGPNIVIGGGRPRGTLYGVFEFLEQQVGVLWMDENDTHIPRHTTLAVPGTLNRKGKPTFSIRGIFVFPRDDQKRIRYMIRNRDNLFHDQRPFFTDAEKWGMFPVYGSPRACHTFFNYTKDWSAEYTDCFSLDASGNRLRAESAIGPGQVCFSNPLARELFIAKLKEFIAADRKAYPEYYPRIYDISANDSPDKCVCPGCLALAEKYGDYSGAQLEFINAIADGIADDYPDVMVQTFAYMFTEDAPTGIASRPNVIIRLAQLDAEFKDGIRDIMRPLANPLNGKLLARVLAWGALGKISIWDYLTLFSGENEGLLNIGTSATNLRLYEANNVEAYFAEFQKPDAAHFYALRMWLAYRLLQDPDQDVSTLTDRFLQAYFGPAAPFMRELADDMEQKMNQLEDVISSYHLAKRTYLDDGFFEKAEGLLAAAEQAAQGDEKILFRIARERVPLDMARLRLRERVADTLPPGRDAVVDRLERNWPEWVRKFYPVGMQQKQLERIDHELTRLRFSARAALPEEFEDRDVVDILWTSFEPYSQFGVSVVDEPDAAAGKAMKLATPTSVAKAANNHKGGLTMGVWSHIDNKYLATTSIPAASLPQDEMFHLHRLGRVTLDSKCKIFVHKSWAIQHRLGEFFESGGLPNEYDIYVSLKLVGPSYVKGSTKEDAVLMDRILLVKPE